MESGGISQEEIQALLYDSDTPSLCDSSDSESCGDGDDDEHLQQAAAVEQEALFASDSDSDPAKAKACLGCDLPLSLPRICAGALGDPELEALFASDSEDDPADCLSMPAYELCDTDKAAAELDALFASASDVDSDEEKDIIDLTHLTRQLLPELNAAAPAAPARPLNDCRPPSEAYAQRIPERYADSAQSTPLPCSPPSDGSTTETDSPTPASPVVATSACRTPASGYSATVDPASACSTPPSAEVASSELPVDLFAMAKHDAEWDQTCTEGSRQRKKRKPAHTSAKKGKKVHSVICCARDVLCVLRSVSSPSVGFVVVCILIAGYALQT